MSKEVNSGNGISFLVLLTILFIGLKLTNYIDWSWWFVLSPIWILIVALVVVWGILFGTFYDDGRD